MRLAEHIDDPVFRRDGTSSVGAPAWSSPTDDLTGPMFSVLARVSRKTGELLERVRYRPYGEARHQWGHDVDGDGDADPADESIVTTASGLSAVIGNANYDVDADLDRDGDVDAVDEEAWSATGNKAAHATGTISEADAVVGWSGYLAAMAANTYHIRNRVRAANADIL
jgi:hypothetical protein